MRKFQFYSDVAGTRKTRATCGGSKTTGMTAHVRGWDVGVRVFCDHIDGKDVVRVYQTKGSNGDKGGSNDQLIATIIENTTTIVRVPDDCL